MLHADPLIRNIKKIQLSEEMLGKGRTYVVDIHVCFELTPVRIFWARCAYCDVFFW